jgi:hypothetical protein
LVGVIFSDPSVFSEFFLSAMRFTRGQVLELNFMNRSHSLMVLTAWLWGLFGMAFFIYSQFDCRIALSAFLFVEMLSFLLLASFYVCAIKALHSIPSDLRRSALAKAAQDFSKRRKTQGDDDDVHDSGRSEIQRYSEFFKLTVKDRL